MRFVNLSAKDSAKLTIDAVLIFWQQARIPTRRDDKCCEKLLKIYEEWKPFGKKDETNLSNVLKKKIDTFTNDLDDLFDIASADAMQQMKIDEDKEFLEKQRQKGRPGSMLGIDSKLAGKEERSRQRKEKENERRLRYEKSFESQQSGEQIE